MNADNDKTRRDLEHWLWRLHSATRLLPWIIPTNADAERQRLRKTALRRDRLRPIWNYSRPLLQPRCRDWFARAKVLTSKLESAELRHLYEAKLQELELDYALLAALHGPALQQHTRQRFPIPRRVHCGEQSLLEHAQDLLAQRSLADEQDLPVLPAFSEDPHESSLVRMIEILAQAVGLKLRVKVRSDLSAAAVAGHGVITVRHPAQYHWQQCLGYAVHEVLGHAVAHANALRHPWRIFRLGTAGALTDQEGLAVYLEQCANAMHSSRVAVLASRVIAVDLMLAGASFEDIVYHLIDAHTLALDDALLVAERVHRGGGISRDAVYVYGWWRVTQAVEKQALDLHRLRGGRLSLEAVPVFNSLIAAGVLASPLYQPACDPSLWAELARC